MILDGLLLFDTVSAITASNTTQSSTNIIDLLNARDIGVGQGNGFTPQILCLVNNALTTTNSATLKVSAQGSSDSTTWTTYADSPVYSASELSAGVELARFDWPRRRGGSAMPRYLRLLYTVGTGVFSTGAVTSAIVLQTDAGVAGLGLYPPGIAISN
jgi:Bbp16-like protein